MKKYFIHYTLSFIAVLTLLGGCKDGEPGPKGPAGDQGAAGTAGDKGLNALSYAKNGFVSGTITGTGQDGKTPINETFKYEFHYHEPLLPLEQVIRNGQASPNYTIHIERTDSLFNNRIELQFTVATDFKTRALFTAGNLQFTKNTGGNQYKGLRAYFDSGKTNGVPNATISGLTYNSSTNMLSGNYIWISDNTGLSEPDNQYFTSTSTGYPITVKGSFSVKCRKSTITY